MKKLFSLLIGTVLLLILAACVSTSSYNISQLEKSPHGFLRSDDISAAVTTKDIKTSNKLDISIMLTNHGDTDYSFGEDFSLEIKSDDEWYVIPQNDNTAFQALGYTLPSGAIHTLSISLGDYYKKLAAGEYRIIKNLSGMNVPLFVAGEFEIAN